VIFLGFAALLLGQKSPTAGGGGASSSNSGTPSTGAPTGTKNPINNPSLNPSPPNNPSNDPFANQPIFLSGKVMFDDGSPMNKDVHIERVCSTNTRTEANVDNSGHFSFQVGGINANPGVMMDASQSGSSGSQYGGGSNQDTLSGATNTGNSRRMGSEASLWGCELRASYPGYRSDVISLAGRRTMDDPNVGTIILHRLGNVQGTTISVTTAEAPKSAQKSFEKGLQAARKGNFEEAEKRFLAATGEYPKYALAWFALGQAQAQQNRAEEARKAYLTAVDADKHYVSPLDQLALLAARENKWDEAAGYSKRVIELNPVEFPSAYWYNTVANYNLTKDQDAIKSAKALLKLDTQHRFPEVNRLLAELSLQSKDYAGAAEYLKAYLAQVPNAKDADTLKQQLLKIEEARATTPQ
jgi:tetratricopeptide (TPR) repeat protein